MSARVATARPINEEPLISIGEAALDRMPALTMIYEQTAANFTRLLEELCEAPAALSFERLDARRAAEAATHCEGLTHVFIYQAQGLGSKVAIAVGASFFDLCVDLLLGSTVLEEKEPRAISNIDRRLTAFALTHLLDSLAAALKPITDVTFERDIFGEEAGFAALGQKASVAIIGHCRLRAAEREGGVAILLPRAALDPFRAALAKFPGAEGLGHDERWSENLYDHVISAEVQVDVKIEARNFTLGDLAALEVGDVLRLPIAPTSPIRIESEGRTLFWCTLGQKDGRYTVRLEEFSDERQSFIENILGL